MEPEIDVYRECFCGSGKKMKFCCAPIAPEMFKILRMREQHQYQMALQAIEQLEKKPMPNAWSRSFVRLNKATILIALDQVAESEPLLEQILAEVPDHFLALPLHATVIVSTRGFQEGRAAVYRAFRYATSRNPGAIANLAALLGGAFMGEWHVMAACRILSFARALDAQDSILERWLSIVSAARQMQMPYALYSHYELRPVGDPQQASPELQSALELAGYECWADAAAVFEKLARQASGQTAADLWHNAGLSYAFGCEEAAAIAAFRAAAQCGANFELAVDDESLAQALESLQPDRWFELQAVAFHVRSVSKMLTLLDQHPLFFRGESEDEEITASYTILDRSPALAAGETASLANLPIVRADLRIIDVHPGHNHPAMAQLMVWPADTDTPDAAIDRVAELVKLLRDVAGSELESEEHRAPVGKQSIDRLTNEPRWLFDPMFPWTMARSLLKERSQRILHDVWPNRPLAALGGKTPHEAIGVPELKVPLAAAIVMLDALFESRHWMFDEGVQRSRCGLPAIEAFRPAHVESLSGVSLLELRHLPLHEFSDSELSIVANRLNLTPHNGLIYNVLVEVLGRPSLLEKNVPGKIYMKLAQLCQTRFSIAEARAWLQKARQDALARKVPLEEMLDLDFNEIAIRLDDDSDKELPAFALQFWNLYTRKLPQTRESLSDFLSMTRLTGPWNGPQDAGTDQLAGATTPGGIWTPQAEPAAQTSKLWLPGQD